MKCEEIRPTNEPTPLMKIAEEVGFYKKIESKKYNYLKREKQKQEKEKIEKISSEEVIFWDKI